ncbi:hypothetical protein ONE63_002429 [Megalurothrips usitatus]|uniref:Uncharacterized protein n=1 Tax=Megalurothrips usitatus TaxID=439358 RepID=A0AAV7X860_9NEOP|nr:hypothetical protein ONE63_002429 [Megalurothrips usitatus]
MSREVHRYRRPSGSRRHGRTQSRSRSRSRSRSPSRDNRSDRRYLGPGPGPNRPLPPLADLQRVKINLRNPRATNNTPSGIQPVAIEDLKIPRAKGEGRKPLLEFLLPPPPPPPPSEVREVTVVNPSDSHGGAGSRGTSSGVPSTRGSREHTYSTGRRNESTDANVKGDKNGVQQNAGESSTVNKALKSEPSMNDRSELTQHPNAHPAGRGRGHGFYPPPLPMGGHMGPMGPMMGPMGPMGPMMGPMGPMGPMMGPMRPMGAGPRRPPPIYGPGPYRPRGPFGRRP